MQKSVIFIITYMFILAIYLLFNGCKITNVVYEHQMFVMDCKLYDIILLPSGQCVNLTLNYSFSSSTGLIVDHENCIWTISGGDIYIYYYEPVSYGVYLDVDFMHKTSISISKLLGRRFVWRYIVLDLYKEKANFSLLESAHKVVFKKKGNKLYCKDDNEEECCVLVF